MRRTSPPSTRQITSPFPAERITKIAWLAILLYGMAFLFAMLGDVLVQAPQLDAKENLLLAGQIERGNLPSEPLYRGMLYPLLLSLLHPVAWRIAMASILGFACHLLNAWLVCLLAKRIWQNYTAGLLAAAFYFLNPASLFFSVQLFDITPAISLFLAGLYFGLTREGTKGKALLMGLFLGLACLARPHFLPLALFAPLILLLYPGWRRPGLALAWLPVLALLLAQGTINKTLSGEFRILPWQGSYNFWAANRPKSNGLYFTQAIDVAGRGNDLNPTRAESIALYARAHPDQSPPFSIGTMNDYWKGRFFQRLLDEPINVAKLWFFKGYAVLNSYEQYNNLTFSFHRARIPLLRYNPLNWGILLMTGAVGFMALGLKRKRLTLGLALFALGYAATLILFYASARFRLPLVPMMAIGAGGLAGQLGVLFHTPSRKWTTGILLLILAVSTFSSFGIIRDRSTFIQDRLLIANSHADLGHDVEAAHFARQVLAEQPLRQEALRIYTVSYFNLHLINPDAATDLGTWDAQKHLVIQHPPTDPIQDAILGVYYWKWQQLDQARALWTTLRDPANPASTLAMACLAVTTASPPEKALLSPLEKALDHLLNVDLKP